MSGLAAAQLACRHSSSGVMMRFTVLAVLLALVAGASATSTWADIQKVVAAGATGEFSHGPELIYGGEEWNGDKTVLRSTNSYAAKSVITGKDSYYPLGLPETLKTPYLVPDSTHPKLAFWYAPAPSPEQGSTCQVAARLETKCAKMLTRDRCFCQVHTGRL